MAPHVVTFGYDHGDPPEADQVFNVRGAKYDRKDWARVAKQIADQVGDDETVAIGCKHGHTRSVNIAELVAKQLTNATVDHLDKDRQESPEETAMLKGTSKHVISENIREMKKSGHPEKRAIAAAYHHAGSKGKKFVKKPAKMPVDD